MNVSDTTFRSADRWKRPAIVIGGILSAGPSLAAVFGLSSDAIAGAPFVLIDVAVVSLLVAMPFAVVVATSLIAAIPRVVAVLLSIALLATPPALIRVPVFAELLSGERATEWSLAGLRMLFGIVAAIGGTLFITAMLGRESNRYRGTRSGTLVTAALLLVFAAAVPEVYVDARCRRERERMHEFAGSGRVTDALSVARPLAMLRPGDVVDVGNHHAVSIESYIRMLEESEQALKRQLLQLAASDSADARLRRARLLGQLSRRWEAVDELLPVEQFKNSNHQLEACVLLGLLYADDEDWGSGLEWYQRAVDHASGLGPQANAQLSMALKGIGYTSRKLGSYSNATHAYEALIAVEPTAANHFLLAQFYEDAQEGEKARRHAERAIQLAPARFGNSGRRLIDRIVTSHFGCFQAYSRDSRTQ